MIVEKVFTQTMEELIESFLKFFYGFLRTNWHMLRHPNLTAERLVRQSTYDAFEFTLPYTFFTISYMVNFLFLRSFFTVLHAGKPIVDNIRPTLAAELAAPMQVDPVFAFLKVILKAIPLFGIIMLASYILGKRFRFSESLQKTSNEIFCYCYGFFWNSLTVSILLLLAFANLWIQFKSRTDPHMLIHSLYAILGLISMGLLFACYRFNAPVFKALLTQDTSEENLHFKPTTVAILFFTVGIVAGLMVEYGMSLLEASITPVHS